MASPQLENGYTRIANELLDAICGAKLNGTQSAIVLAVIRETYGFGRKAAEIGTTRLAAMTKAHRTRVALEMSRLITAGILIELAPASFGRCRTIAINKNHSLWNALQSADTITVNESATVNENKDSTVNESVDETVSGSVDHINKPSKKTLKKSSLSRNSATSENQVSRWSFEAEDKENALALKTAIDTLDPSYYAGERKPPSMDRWANEFRLIRTADGRSRQDILELIAGFPRDSFWSQNVRAPAALRGVLKDGRDRFTAILHSIRRNNERKNGHPNGQANGAYRGPASPAGTNARDKNITRGIPDFARSRLIAIGDLDERVREATRLGVIPDRASADEIRALA